MDLRKELGALDRLLNEVYSHSESPERTSELLHALRNLSHVSGLLADVLGSSASLRLLEAEDSQPRAS